MQSKEFTMTHPLACSAFWLKRNNTFLLGRNLDVPFTDGYVMTNPKGKVKKSVLSGNSESLNWESIYGSLTFNLLGKGFPMGGMNEAGLVVEHLHMPGTEYPEPRGEDVLLEFEWIQYMLDTCRSVHEVITAAERVSILPGRIEMHFILADREGNAALVEFRNGEMQVSDFAAARYPAVTNNWYGESLEYLDRFEPFGGGEPLSYESRESLDRFAIVADRVQKVSSGLDKDELVGAAFGILESVEESTLLSVVYDPMEGQMLYRSRDNRSVRALSFEKLDFSASSGSVMVGIHQGTDCVVPFDQKLNDECICGIVAPNEEFLMLGKYVESMCEGLEAG